MAVIQPRSAEAFLRRPDSHLAVVLLYGPDTGLVSERAKRWSRRLSRIRTDPFQMVKRRRR